MLGIGLYVFIGIIAVLFIIVIILAIVTVTRSKKTGQAPFGGDSKQGGVGENYDVQQRVAGKSSPYGQQNTETRNPTGTQ